MNDSPEALAAAMVAYRFADEDAARLAYLAAKLAAEYVPRNLCKRGHDDWVKKSGGGRRCKTCHALAMAASRERRGI